MFETFRSVKAAVAVAMFTTACLVAILPDMANAAPVEFRRRDLNTDSTFSACAVFDVNKDGRLDVVCGGWWYEAPDFKKHFVRDVEVIRGRFDGYSHLPYDVDGDGWTDVINVNYRSSSLFWVRHPGNALEGPWKKYTIALPGAMETGRLYDIDGDGQLDILPDGVQFASWWEHSVVETKDGKTKYTFIRHDLPDAVAAHGVGFGDIDGDGRGDVIGPKGWLEAPEDPRGGEWAWHAEFELDGRASIPILVVDADGDGDSDIVWGDGHGYGVFWLEQIPANAGGDGAQREWRRHEIDLSWSQAHALLWEDVDGDGVKDLITGKRYMAHDGKDPGAYEPLVIYWYSFEKELKTWTRHVISSGTRAGFGLDPKAADLDGDGDLDLVVAGRSGLYWMENLKGRGEAGL